MTRILVAEDDKNLRENIIFLLKKSGYDVDGVKNGLEALEKYQQQNYNMIISDIMMPYMDGLELYAKIKDKANLEMIPFIFLSAKADRDSVRNGMELGADDYLTKPFVARELLGAIKTRLDKNELIRRTKSAEILKSEFLSQISHEIRTPLQAINSLISLLNMDNANLDSKQTEELLKLIGLSGQRLTRIVEMLIIMSELNGGTYHLIKEKFSIADDIIAPLINEKYSHMINAKGLKLEISSETESTIISADKESLIMIFDNLLDNAVKFTNKGVITISYLMNKEKLYVKIFDTGIGISEEFIKNIYEPFTQEESGYTRSFEGAGLGLSLCKQLCEMNKIRLKINSTKGHGTTVETEYYLSEN